MALDIVLLQGPRRGVFLMSEVPLYSRGGGELPQRAGGRIPPYRATSRTRKRTPLGPYRRPMPRVLGGSVGGGRFFMSEVPL